MQANIGVERAVIAGICQHGESALLDIEDIIEEDSFTVVENKALYHCLKTIIDNGNEVDQANLTGTIEQLGYTNLLLNNKKDFEYLGSLFHFSVSENNVKKFAIKLKKLHIARRAIQKHHDAIESLNAVDGNENIDHILRLSEDPIFDLVMELNKGKDTGPYLLADHVEDLVNHLIENPCENIGLSTPWPLYNFAIGSGLRRGGVNLISARPKQGKSSAAKEVALHFTTNLKIPVLMLDTEMVMNDQIIRSLSSLSNRSLYKIESGKFATNYLDKQEVLKACEKLKDNKLFWYESIAGKPFEEVLSIIRRWILKYVGYNNSGDINDCVVIYDYFKLMDRSQLDDIQEYQAMGFQISRLTDFCKEFDFACLAFVQLNRQNDISQSDRLRWLCHSYSKFEMKDNAEIAVDGAHNGNKKMTILDTRFGPGIFGDYINMQFNGDTNRIIELTLHSEQPTAPSPPNTQFETES